MIALPYRLPRASIGSINTHAISGIEQSEFAVHESDKKLRRYTNGMLQTAIDRSICPDRHHSADAVSAYLTHSSSATGVISL